MTTATATSLHLPALLADLDLKLGKALNTPVRQVWPEPDKFMPAECPEAIAKVLIHSSKLHARLSSAKIAYLFRETLERKAAVASKAGGKLAFLADVDFTVEFSHATWLKLTPEQRIALVDHELTHCDRDMETGAWMMRRHDVEEFSEVIGRWGLWNAPLRGFGVAVESAQLEIFVPMEQFAEEDEPDDQADAERQRIKRGGK